MKVYLNPMPDNINEGGIKRVLENQVRYLPDYGIEFVNTIGQADIVNCHVTSIVDHPNLVLSCHGLYWEDDVRKWQGTKWVNTANTLLVQGMRKAKAVTVPSRWVANAVTRGMMIKPFICNHGVTLEEWDVRPPQGYVLWNKNRHDPSCDSSVVNKLAGMAPSTQFVTTFGSEDTNVKVTGVVDHSQMKEYIQSASVYLATAKETFGVGILEAMASGVPVLGWDYGGQQEIITHSENGYLAKPGDYTDLYNGLLYCMKYHARLGEYGREVVRERYQWKDVISDYIPAYRAALKSYPVKVSVIITAYNLEKYLEESIKSVLNQTYPDFELIIVDDCSTDHSGAIADEWVSRDTRIKVIHNKKNVHVAESRNIGIRSSHGEYIITLDADDRLAPDALALLVKGMDIDNDIHIATGAMEVFTEGRDESFVSGWPPSNPNVEDQLHKNNQLPYASMYRRNVWESTGGYRRRIHTGVEDADFWTRALSYGFKAAKVTDKPTLLYLMRSDSLSHVNKGERFLDWHVHSKNDTLRPFGSKGGKNIPSYNPTLLSVVIPVGPGHEIYLQDCMDSLLNQTLIQWEAIIVNDTGMRWFNRAGDVINPYAYGLQFATIIDSQGPAHGPAWARNEGLAAVKTDKVVFLDADDYAQPNFLEVLYNTQQEVGGYCYSDWYADNGEKIYIDQGYDFSAETLLSHAVGPVSGIYNKVDLDLVNGFDEEIKGWEDWDLHLSLLENCICGTRIVAPLFTYRYRTGKNRDKDFDNKDVLLKYITSKHNKLYGEGYMGCSACGGGSVSLPPKTISQASDITNEQSVLIKYIGPESSVRHAKSQIHLGHTYEIVKDRPFPVYAAEADRFLGRKDYVEVPRERPAVADDYNPVTVNTTVERASYTSLKDLELDPEVVTILEHATIMTADQLAISSDASLLRIKGIGDQRLRKIREALKAHGYNS